MSGGEEDLSSSPSSTAATDFWWTPENSLQLSVGHEHAIKAVLAWPTPIPLPQQCRRITIGFGERLKV
jgi:hypothetical protein